MNKILYFIIFIVVGSTSLVNAQLQLNFSGATVTAGGTVDIDVTVDNFNAIVLMQYSINWDPTVLKFKSIKNVTTVLPQFNSDNIGTPPGAAAVDDGELTVSWSLVSTEPVSIPSTRLFTIELDVIGSPCAETTFILSNEPRNIEVTKDDLINIGAVATNGLVKIDGTNCGGGGSGCADSDDVSLIAANRTVDAGATFCIPVTSKNFTNILGVQTGIKWNTSQLTFTEVKDGALTDVSANAGTSPGELKFVWTVNLGGDAITVSDNTTLFEMCFTASPTGNQTAQVNFVSLPNLAIEISNNNGQAVTSCVSGSTVTIAGGGGGENCNTTNCTTSTDVVLVIDNASTQSGNTVCLEVTARNFNDISSLQTGIKWDPTKLQYKEFKEAALTGISGNDANAANGDIRLLWIIGLSDDPVSLPDNTVLFELCFDVLANTGSACVSFTDLPSFNVEVANANGQSVATCLTNGTVTIGGEPTDNVKLKVNNVSGNQGSETCVDIAVENFTGIESAQFTLQWNASLLTYSRVTNIGLPDFGTSNANNVAADKLRISWSPLSAVTVADDVNIFTVCYNVIGNCASEPTANINIINDGNINIEITNSTNTPLPVDIVAGSIKINACSNQPTITLVDQINPSCNGSATGSIIVNTSGGTGALACEWKNSAGTVVTTNCNLTSVVAGTYTLKVTDASNASSTQQFTITQPSKITIDGSVTHPSCGALGSINLSASGGTGTLTYAWDNGLGSVEDPSGLMGGVYTVTVTDANNCTASNSFTLTDMNTPLTISESEVTSRGCSSAAGVNITVTGGCGARNFSWAGPGGESLNSEDISGVAPGQWNLTITDSGSPVQTVTQSFTIDNDVVPLAVTSQVTAVACNSANSGAIALTVTGGCNPYLYNWTGPNGFTSTTKNITGLVKGTYMVTVTDSRAPVNTAVQSIVVTETDPITASAAVSNVTNIDGNNGSINLTVTGGDGVYTYAWSDGMTVQNRSNLTPGNYTVTIMDGQGCTLISPFEIVWAAIFVNNIVATNPTVSCKGEQDGQISGAAAGGCGGTEIRVNGILSTLPLSGLAPGSYNVVVRDACGNSASKDIIIGEPNELLIGSTVLCSDVESDNGSVSLTITGGTPAYEFTWSRGTISTDGKVSSDLAEGSISVLITDMNGCQAVRDFAIEQCTTPRSCDLYTSIISPNADGLNDVFLIECLRGTANQPNEFSVYDRWGKQVYLQSNYDNSWSGTNSSNEDLVEGGYMWVLVIELNDGTQRIEKGTVSILRSRL